MDKRVKIRELFDVVPSYLEPLFASLEYPWEMLPRLGEYIAKIIREGLPGYTLASENLLVGEGVRIHPTATVDGPTIIGNNTEIRPGAFIRGRVIIGAGCVVGNSTEIKGSVLLDGVQVPHYNYVGDSILGYKAHTGAGVVCSNLKSDGKAVVVHGERDYETGLRKLGAILGDYADIGCNSVLNPGTRGGKRTTVYPLTRLRGVYPSGCIVKSENVYVEKEQR